MATNHQLTATSRKIEGKGASRRLRTAGYVPAIVYGANEAPQAIQVLHNDVLLGSRFESFYSSVIDLTVDGKKQKVLIKDWQKHPFRQLMLHMDFLRVNENEAVKVAVPIHFLNQEKSPAGKTSGLVISHNLTEVVVSCLPKHLPEFIELDLATLDAGSIIHLSDLKLPANVEIPELALGKEHDVAVVTVASIQEEVDPEAPAAEGDASTEDKK
ncbi:MAG: 50S ribosomal protein L25/general stress protein Ctc [Luteibacter sp.]|uniref:50S ribosomal protein L25/general stress protein Ctc n=1 Tax=Rhodanobacteraceae TaxID=1775411 RepID=UPI00055DBB9A|nr:MULTISPECIES: 50S ribosomal protein L25/general stress protein Ctc [Rhodanobacteraceae]MDQ7997646.1 50S ribosomal protein L25/general stress protein Ctc [Luteibacter sp.]MDQ8051244.1 50S ribosomal protein L25/general stress protein Ctc [Luteibacter sp.]MDR6642564.1 large subunit ribosomal protein L25 [Luteibacter sp. 1214]SDG43388.1 large subunit ribosomal protein L25 [Dyella sp. 333MFSha]